MQGRKYNQRYQKPLKSLNAPVESTRAEVVVTQASGSRKSHGKSCHVVCKRGTAVVQDRDVPVESGMNVRGQIFECSRPIPQTASRAKSCTFKHMSVF